MPEWVSLYCSVEGQETLGLSVLLGGILCLLFAGAAGVDRVGRPDMAWRWGSPLSL